MSVDEMNEINKVYMKFYHQSGDPSVFMLFTFTYL